MRKRLLAPISKDAPAVNTGRLDLDRAAVVEVTSEEKDYPVEAALISGEKRGWRAAESGAQTIRVIFDQPHTVRRISLVFQKNTTNPTHSFASRGSVPCGPSFR